MFLLFEMQLHSNLLFFDKYYEKKICLKKYYKLKNPISGLLAWTHPRRHRRFSGLPTGPEGPEDRQGRGVHRRRPPRQAGEYCLIEF